MQAGVRPQPQTRHTLVHLLACLLLVQLLIPICCTPTPPHLPQVFPEAGTVCFSAGLHGWAFTLTVFAKLYAKKFGEQAAYAMIDCTLLISSRACFSPVPCSAPCRALGGASAIGAALPRVNCAAG